MTRSALSGGAACALSVALLFAAALPSPARAETFHHCTGFIDALPAVVATGGTWCLRKDLATSLGGGTVIEIKANNVTIDCNGYRIGNLAAPPPRSATGIEAMLRNNLVVRNCALRGFGAGIYFYGGYGHLIEDSIVDGARYAGIWADGDHSTVRRNRVVDTGIDDDGGEGGTTAIMTQGDGTDVYGNVVQGVFGAADEGEMAIGVAFFGFGHWVHDNHVSNIVDGGGGIAGIRSNSSSQSVVEGNTVVNPDGIDAGVGVDVHGGSARPVCSDNHIRGFASAMPNCIDGGGNYAD